MSYCLGGLPNTPPAYIFTFNSPAEHWLTFFAQPARILLAINAFGGSKVANFSSVAEDALTILNENNPITNPKSFFFIKHPS